MLCTLWPVLVPQPCSNIVQAWQVLLANTNRAVCSIGILMKQAQQRLIQAKCLRAGHLQVSALFWVQAFTCGSETVDQESAASLVSDVQLVSGPCAAHHDPQ